MGKAAKRKRLSGEERKEQILDVGLQVFAQYGYEATNLDEVAAAAGITKPVIYDYFKNKQAFFDAIMDREMKEVYGRIMRAVDPARDRPVVEQAVAAFFEYLQDRPNGFRAMTSHSPISWSGDDRRSEHRRRLYRARIKDIAAILDHFDDPSDPTLVTFHIVGSLTFVGENWLASGRKMPLEEAVQQLSQLIRFGFPGARNR
ncbi:MAG: TetR/AcrR family transcriptional regulator [Myxococcota bacterium]